MAQFSYLLSTLLMGLFLVAVVAFLRLADQRSYSPSMEGSGAGGNARAVLDRVVRSPTAWIVGFLLAVFAAGLAAIVSVGGLVPSEEGIAAAGLVVAAIVAVLVVGYLLWGAYATARARGYQYSTAVMVSSWVFGLLFILAITVQLLV